MKAPGWRALPPVPLPKPGNGIRVNVLNPGTTETPGLANLLTEEQKAGAVALIPLGRPGTPDDLGKAAVFLASDARM